MSTVRTRPQGTLPAEPSPPSTSEWSNRDHAALPARALGPKAATLHARRQLHLAVRPDYRAQRRTSTRLSTADAALSYVLQGNGDALYVERTQRRPLGTVLIQSVVFSTQADFARWCDAEPLRFQDPVLHQRLRRHGEEFFGALR